MIDPPLMGLAPEERPVVYDRTYAVLGIPAHMPEKDAWVCWVLGQLFELPDARAHFIFKGGTSLSKVWKAIHRFSEDIDISLSREWLGFDGERDPEAAKGGQRKRLLKELAAACSSKLRDEVLPMLVARARAALGDSGWSLDIASDDPQAMLFAYPSSLPQPDSAIYVQPVVRIECGARSDRWPIAEQSVVPYIAEAIPDAFPNAGFKVPVLDVERTFWEKATILHAEAHRPADKEMPERYSRHYADLAALTEHPAGAGAVSRDDLRARVVEHKQVFFSSTWASYPTAVAGTFKLLPSEERLAQLAADYRAMRDMYFRPPTPWRDIVANLAALESRINTRPPPSAL